MQKILKKSKVYLIDRLLEINTRKENLACNSARLPSSSLDGVGCMKKTEDPKNKLDGQTIKFNLKRKINLSNL